MGTFARLEPVATSTPHAPVSPARSASKKTRMDYQPRHGSAEQRQSVMQGIYCPPSPPTTTTFFLVTAHLLDPTHSVADGRACLVVFIAAAAVPCIHRRAAHPRLVQVVSDGNNCKMIPGVDYEPPRTCEPSSECVQKDADGVPTTAWFCRATPVGNARHILPPLPLSPPHVWCCDTK